MKLENSMVPDLEFLRSRIKYFPETGEAIWLKHQKKFRIGTSALYVGSHGYSAIHLKDRTYRAHRVLWMLHYGEWPTGTIDHINGDKADNRIENLRIIPHQHNCNNMRKARTHNKSGFLGVSKNRNRFCARIGVNGRMVYIGLYKTAEEAHAAYIEAKRRLHLGNTL